MKEKIIATALARFLQYGIRSMTIKRLVEPLGISTKTVYKYFPGKEDLLKACLVQLYQGFFDEFLTFTTSKDSPVRQLRDLFLATLEKDFGVSHAFFHDINYYYPALQNAVIAKHERNYAKVFVPLFQRGIDEGYFLSHLDPLICLHGIGVLYSSITRPARPGLFKQPPAILFRNLVEVYIRGLCTEKGLRELDAPTSRPSTSK